MWLLFVARCGDILLYDTRRDLALVFFFCPRHDEANDHIPLPWHLDGFRYMSEVLFL